MPSLPAAVCPGVEAGKFQAGSRADADGAILAQSRKIAALEQHLNVRCCIVATTRHTHANANLATLLSGLFRSFRFKGCSRTSAKEGTHSFADKDHPGFRLAGPETVLLKTWL